MTDRGGPSDAAAEARRERRQWIREHHPDRGGDPTVFTAGLAARGQRTGSPRPSVRRTRPLRRRLRSIRKRARALLFRRRPRRRRVV